MIFTTASTVLQVFFCFFFFFFLFFYDFFFITKITLTIEISVQRIINKRRLSFISFIYFY
jgi:hypothetical protein